VIMLLNVSKEEHAHANRGVQPWIAILGALFFLGMFWLAFWRTGLRIGGPHPLPLTEAQVSLKGLATALFTDYLLPFEIVGLLLLVAVIGATVAARRAGQSGSLEEDVIYVSGDEPRTDPLLSGPDPRRPSVAEPAYKPSPKEA
jgi:hypothetical protein